MNGEDLQGLTLQELQKLEEHLKRSLTNVSKVKVCALYMTNDARSLVVHFLLPFF